METTWLPHIRQDICTGCGDCVALCPENALTTTQGKAALTYPDRCTYCALCEDVCPVAAIDLPFLICFVNEAS